MRVRYRRALFFLPALLLVDMSSLMAHPGGLNAQGCHNNRKTGEYHCHRAQSAAPPPQPPQMPPPEAPRGSLPTEVRPLISISPALTTAHGCQASERELVLTAQLLLKALGYRIDKTAGVVDFSTTTAVREFQETALMETSGAISGELLVRLSEAVLRSKS